MPKMKVWDGTAWIVLDANDADTVDGKHASDFAPSSHVGSGGGAHAVATTSVAGFMSATDKAKLDRIQAGAEVNQNAFTTVRVGSTNVVADEKTDVLELVAGTNITLTPDAVNDKITIGVNGVASLDRDAKVPTTQLPSASTTAQGIVQLNDTVTSTSTTQAATANAVKQAYDKAIQAETNAKSYTDQQLATHSTETASKFTNINLNIIDMAVELETLKDATLNGVTANIFIETFTNLNDINLMRGGYDSVNKRLVL